MGAERVHISIVVVGHVNSGKSTTVGHLIHMLGGIEEHAIQRIEEQAAEMNRASFKYAWVLDKLKAERERGLTMDISVAKLQTPNYLLSVIDAPGHRDFIHHLIAGTSMADCALLMIDASPGAFEEGISRNGHGQTREHALLARTFGIRQIICCCNKMDATTPVYSPDRYDEIVNKTSSLLEKVGFRREHYTFIPMSGFAGDNLVEMSPNLSWFQGPTLLHALDQLAMPTRPVKKENPLRLPIVCVRLVDGVGTVAVGRVQSGSLKPGMAVNFAPFDVTQELTAEVKSVQRHKHHEATREALPGDIVGFNVSGIPWKTLKRGLVASNSVDDRAWGASSFTALVSVLDYPGQISKGYTAILHCHTSHVPVTFVEIIRTVVMESSNVIRTIEKRPPFLQRKDVAEVRMVPKNPVVLESNSENPPLGRFAVRDLDLNNTVAVGIVRSVEKMIPTRQQKLEMELAKVDAKIEGLAAKIKCVKRDLKKSEGLLQGNEMKIEVHSHLLGLAGDRKGKELSELKHCKQRMQNDLLRHKLKLDSSFSRKVDSKKVDDLRQSLQCLEKELKDLEESKGVLKREMKVAKHTKS